MSDGLMRRVLEVQSASGRTEKMTNFIAAELRRIDPSITIKRKRGNLYATKGNAEVYPCIVAHTDTVHAVIPDRDYHVYTDGLVWFAFDSGRKEQCGVGGDDKVGIYIALRMVEQLDNVKVAFFRDEEVGCQGSAVANMQFFEDCAFVLQCDRRGYGDFVQSASGTELYGDAFAEAIAPIIEGFKFKPTWGAMTDVMELKDRGLKVACANMSCGYYRPHTAEEYVTIAEVDAVEAMVLDLCESLGHHQWLHDKPKGKSYATWYGKDDDWDYKRYSYGSRGTERFMNKYDVTTQTYVSRCEDCGIYDKTTKWRKEHQYMECDECYDRVEDLMDRAEKGEVAESSTMQLALPDRHLSVEEWNQQIILDADMLRIRKNGPTDNDFSWALDEANLDWSDDFKMEVIQMFYELGGCPIGAGEELLAEAV